MFFQNNLLSKVKESLHFFVFLTKDLLDESYFLIPTQNISRTNDDAATIQTMVAAGMGIGILTELEVEKAPMPLNLSYIPLETDGIQEILYVIYSRKNENPLIPLFLEEMKK